VRGQTLRLLAAVLTVVLAAGVAFGEELALRIPEVVATLAGRDVTVSARLEPGLPADVVKRLASGLPTTAVWEMRLMVLRNNWWDGLRDERSYAVTATYRPVSGDYTVERRIDGRLLDTVVVPTRAEAERVLAGIPGIPAFTMGPHLAGKPLVVRVRCVYGTGMLLGLLPVRTMTDWRRSPAFSWSESGTTP
jgi:hypothetical protein